MLTVNASDSFGNIECVAFGESSLNLSQSLNTETELVVFGKTSVRDDRVSIFMDSVVPLTQWVAKIAKTMTVDVRDKSVLEDVKKVISGLPSGNTKIILNLYSDEKNVSLALKKTVELGATTAKDLTALGIKVDIE